MPLVLFLLISAGAFKLWSDHQAVADRIAARASAYRHPALQPATIYSPEFYASLSARYNRPFLGK